MQPDIINMAKPKVKSESVIVVFIVNGKLITYEFSTISNAKLFTKDLNGKQYIIIIGHLATDGFDGM